MAITSPSAAVAETSNVVGDARDRERVVAAGGQLVGEAGEEAAAVVLDRGGLAVHELPRRADLAAEGLGQRLVAEADAERGDAAGEAAEDLERRAGVGRAAGTGGDDEVRRLEPLRPVGVDRVVPADHDVRAELAEQVREVVGEAVVVVDQEDHARRLRQVDRLLERGQLRAALGVLGGGIGVGDDARSRLQVRDAVRQDDRADGDAGVERPVRQRVADRARVRPAPVSLELRDQLHGAHLRRAGDASRRGSRRAGGRRSRRRRSSSPVTSETRWLTCEKRSGCMNRSTRTLPGRHTRERSLRPRSTSMTCSARSFSERRSSCLVSGRGRARDRIDARARRPRT